MAPPLSAGFMMISLSLDSDLIAFLSSGVMFWLRLRTNFDLPMSISFTDMNVSRFAEPVGGRQVDFLLSLRKLVQLPYGLIFSSDCKVFPFSLLELSSFWKNCFVLSFL